MLRCSILFSLAAALIFSILIDPGGLYAQSIWLDRSHDKTVSLEILKPNFEGEDNTTFTTSALFLSGRFPAKNKITAVLEIPFAHLGFDSEFGDNASENTFGNPYFGIEIHGANSPVFGEIGIRPPISPDDDEDNGGAAFVGLLTEFVDRAEAFVSNAVPISGAINYFHKNARGFVLRLRGRPSLWINTGDGGESETFLLYSAKAGYESPKISLAAGFTGR